MLKKDIEELQEKAVSFLQQLDATAKELDITLVNLQEGKMVFMDNESGVQVSADLIVDPAAKTVQSVDPRHSVGEPGIVMGKAPKKTQH